MLEPFETGNTLLCGGRFDVYARNEPNISVNFLAIRKRQKEEMLPRLHLVGPCLQNCMSIGRTSTCLQMVKIINSVRAEISDFYQNRSLKFSLWLHIDQQLANDIQQKRDIFISVCPIHIITRGRFNTGQYYRILKTWSTYFRMSRLFKINDIKMAH